MSGSPADVDRQGGHTDAIVAAYADTRPEPVVLTSDPVDLTALAAHTRRRVTIARV